MFHGILSQFISESDRLQDAIRVGASDAMSDQDFIATEIRKWLHSKRRKIQLKGESYYKYHMEKGFEHHFDKDADGMPIHIDKSNHLVLDNQYANLVDQKVNYVMGKPFVIQTQNEAYTDALKYVFDKNFKRMMQAVTVDALNCGIAWVHPYYNEQGEMCFKHFAGHEIMPFWKDDEHTQLDLALRYYTTIKYEGRNELTVHHVEVYSTNGIQRYILQGGMLIEDVEMGSMAYAVRKNDDGTEEALAWDRIPLIPFKYNQHEIPLILRVESLQDAINETRTNWNKTMQEDIRTAVLAVKGYEGENVSELRQKIMQHGAVLLAGDGSVEVLNVNRESGAYIEYLDKTKKAIVENGRGFDAKDDRMSSNPNEMNLRSMYSDIDLDSDMLETQFQASFDQLLWFVDKYLIAAGSGDFTSEEVIFTFDRNMIVNDADTINNIKNSVGLVSNETLLARHPFVVDVEAELERLEKEQEEQMSSFGGNDYIQQMNQQDEDENQKDDDA